MSDRQGLLRDAVAFLRDPKVASSPLTQRVQFLETKGLTSEEIETALAEVKSTPIASPPSPERPDAEVAIANQASHGADYRPRPAYSSPSGSGYTGTMVRHPPPLPGRDWRDFFIMAVVSGGVMYGMVAMARKYLLPHLRPPTQTAFEQTSSSLAEQFDEATKLLNELQTQTTTLQNSVEEERSKVDTVVTDVEEAVRAVKEGEERWREEMRELRDEVGEVRELVPRMLEKHAQTQAASLLDLQSELKSLKTLLLARRPATSPAPAPTANGPASPLQEGAGASSTERAANALLQPRPGSGLGFANVGKPSIPAWQLAGSSAANGSSSQVNGDKSGENTTSSSQAAQVETVADEE